MAKVWLDLSPAPLAVLLGPADARDEIEAYAASVGLDAAPALATIGNEPVRFNALALDARGAPVPVQNSDAGFALLFLDLPPDTAVQIGTSVARPFPAGLRRASGWLSPIRPFAETDLEIGFDRS